MIKIIGNKLICEYETLILKNESDKNRELLEELNIEYEPDDDDIDTIKIFFYFDEISSVEESKDKKYWIITLKNGDVATLKENPFYELEKFWSENDHSNISSGSNEEM